MVAQVTQLITYPLRTKSARLALLDLNRVPAADTLRANFLTEGEQAEFDTILHPLRRREWLGARACLKTALVEQGWIGDALDCELRKDRRGRPQLKYNKTDSTADSTTDSTAPDCSLAHKHHWACAGVAESGRIGIDVEQISARLIRLTAMFVGGRETALPGDRSQEEQFTVWWALKEAYSKTVGLGLGLGLTEIVCRETAEGVHEVAALDGPACRAWHVVREGYVLALCQQELSAS